MRELLKKFPDTHFEGVGESSGNDIDELMNVYESIKPFIETRVNDFREVYRKGDDRRIFAELAFCILTPQSNARYCWETICDMYENNILFNGDEESICNALRRVRFKVRKSEYIVLARESFFSGNKSLKEKIAEFDDTFAAREWFVKEIKGLGYKEASHFLRNLGKGDKIAILDRHILRNLEKYGVIEAIPKSLTKTKYCEIENKFARFAEKIAIPLEHMDLLFWYNAKGEIFK
ncbi:MAG: N-glycosylase/DNA lyase [Proteobacteria bacterium]|nr:N-glycosylase/DNA lyase [Pseudomonadota bacterium]